MLVLSRREGEKIVFPNLGVTLEVLRVKGNTARLGVRAPDDVRILRDELVEDEDSPGSNVFSPTRRLSHAVRNRLHAANLALHLFRKQLDRGMVEQAEQTYEKILHEFEALEAEAAALKPEPRAAAGPPRACRTLVVEDDANECELLAGFLRVSGFEVATSGDGAVAIDYLASHDRPDLVLLDMMMPRFDGRATIASIRENPRLADLKVFAISGTSPSELGVPTGPHGVDRWFSKPVNPESLVREISRELQERCTCPAGK
ncbi:MAG: response regulator [Pirellulales bacterium]|nr:response regulator [Pirellulales bacterium]